MKVPLSWLKEYLPTSLSIDEIAEQLTSIGLEVEDTENSILEIALTPNLAHCASIRGVARELAALTGETLSSPHLSVIEEKESEIHSLMTVQVENVNACPRYACRIISGVQVAASPQWLQERLMACGMRSVNNIVDITNLVLLELGHPLHAFDLHALDGKQLFIRNAKKNEKICTLDQKEHFLTEEMLIISDSLKPVAVAGIMGSFETEVQQATSAILLESALFEPKSIRRTAKKLGIQSEASYRFERGCDPHLILEALDYATSLICQIAQGSVHQGIIEISNHTFLPSELSCRLSRLNKVLGTQLAMGEVETLFHRLGLEKIEIQEDRIAVKIPTYRHDLKHEIDLIEEAARLYGYNHIHKKEKAFFRTGKLPSSPEYLFSHKVRCQLIAEGLQEFLTCDLISPMQTSLIAVDNFPTRTLIKLLNPHSVEQSIMRPSMLPGMLNVIRSNADQSIYSLAGFEVGRVHFSSQGRYFEPSVLSVILTGELAPYHWETKGKNVDFFDLKGILENLFQALKISPVSFQASNYSNFHPGRQSEIHLSQANIGILGEVHPLTLKKAGIEKPVYFAELNLEDLLAFVPKEIKMHPLPLFPASSRDWTVTLAENHPIGELFLWIEQMHSPTLESYSLLDVYKGDKLGSGYKNVTLRFVYRDHQKTLSLSDIEREHLRITQRMTEHLQEESP